MTTKYDDVGWHLDAALAAGQPAEHAGTHIGLYVTWLIHRGMHDPEHFTDEWVDAIKRGEMSGSDLMDAIDGKLVSLWMTPEGAAFTDWYYAEGYAADFARVFSNVPAYGLAETARARDRIHPAMDKAFAEWIKLGKPVPDPRPLPMTASLDDRDSVLFLPSPDSWDHFRMSRDAREGLRAEIAEALARGVTVEYYDAPPVPHEYGELERLIPREFTAPPMITQSIPASEWGRSMLSRALKRLGVKPTEVGVAIGQGGDGEAAVTAEICATPGVSAEALWSELPMLVRQPGMKCTERWVARKRVLWCDRPEFKLASWTRDGLIVIASALDEARLEALVERLP